MSSKVWEVQRTANLLLTCSGSSVLILTSKIEKLALIISKDTPSSSEEGLNP